MTTVTDVMRCSPLIVDSDSIRVPYRHVCEYGFKVASSKWYRGLPSFMTLEVCGKEKNVAAWRVGFPGKMSCFVFYWHSNTQNVPLGGIEKGECFIRDRVVPLGSLDPPRQIVTMHHPQHENPLLIT
jgi:hypothetical protein